jgi:predicted Fe-Mo cluster-binding NifX family protein
MKIAIASEGNFVAEHFGHCEGFTIFKVENKETREKEFIANPGHKPGFLPNFLNDLGVKVIIAGGMGGGAIEIFKEKGIEVITGVTGSLETTIEKYLRNELRSSGSVCRQHQHAGECES